jgi:hypothetical protein
MFFLWLPMYWAYLNFKVWVIWASDILLFFQKWLESLWFICSLASHFSTYGNFRRAVAISRLLCSLVMTLWIILLAFM